jgi:uncharacterized protein (TIGR03083 family)
MEIAEHIEALQRAGDQLGDAAERTDLDAPIPTAPKWTMRQLLQHMGEVHRWAATTVAEERIAPIRKIEGVAGPLPHDDDLLDWFREGHANLVATLRSAKPDTECWTFLPARSPLAFWARRQAHETGIHRADAESPSGRITPYPPDLASDGVEEMLFGFLNRKPTDERGDPAGSLQLHASDTGQDWLVAMDTQGADTAREAGDATCSVTATASDLLLLVWNRRTADGLDVSGDRSALDYWRDNVQITWSRER